MNDDVQRQLLPGEKGLWTGRPPTGLRLGARDVFMVPFSLLWAGFAVFWNVSVWRDGAPTFFTLWGIPFLLAGAYFTVGRFLHDAWIRRSQVYLVTDRRIVVFRTGGSSKSKSVDLRRLPMIELSESRSGAGTIRFGPLDMFSRANGFGMWVPSLDPTLQFVGVEHVRQVYDLIQRAAA
jgi:hypothetical protein